MFENGLKTEKANQISKTSLLIKQRSCTDEQLSLSARRFTAYDIEIMLALAAHKIL